ncbi:MAG: hypothetical protein KC621_04985 [Myxococcales bacterium]|nr:hypothetical protein [Myxococcales bacterium]
MVLLVGMALAKDGPKAKDLIATGHFEASTPAEAVPVQASLKPVRLVTECTDTDAPMCVALELTLTNTGSGVVTVDLDRLTSTWWREGRQHPLFAVRQAWSGIDGFSEVVLPPGQSWSDALTPNNRNVPTTIEIQDAVALRDLWKPGYAFQLSFPITAGDATTWYSATFTTTY